MKPECKQSNERNSEQSNERNSEQSNERNSEQSNLETERTESIMPNREMLENRKHSTAYIPYSFYECRIPEFYLNVPMHWHDEFEFILATEGIVTLHVGTVQLSVPKGSAIFINSLYLSSSLLVSISSINKT